MSSALKYCLKLGTGNSLSSPHLFLNDENIWSKTENGKMRVHFDLYENTNEKIKALCRNSKCTAAAERLYIVRSFESTWKTKFKNKFQEKRWITCGNCKWSSTTIPSFILYIPPSRLEDRCPYLLYKGQTNLEKSYNTDNFLFDKCVDEMFKTRKSVWHVDACHVASPLPSDGAPHDLSRNRSSCSNEAPAGRCPYQLRTISKEGELGEENVLLWFSTWVAPVRCVCVCTSLLCCVLKTMIIFF